MSKFCRAVKEILAILRAHFGNRTQYIVGGIHPSVPPEHVLEETRVDALIVGEGEYALHDFLEGKDFSSIQGLWNKDVRNPPRAMIQDLDSIPMPAYHRMADFEKYLIPPGTIRGTWQRRGSIALMSSRGCAGKCIFCNSHLMFSRKLMQRSVDNMIGEIKYIIDNYGKTSFWFADDTFTYNKTWVYEFCKKIKPFKVNWGCQVRSDTITDGLVKKMKDGGCLQADLGIESGPDRVLKILRKGVTREQHLEALAVLRRNKLRSMGTFIVGTPGETYEDIMQTKDLIKKGLQFAFLQHPIPVLNYLRLLKKRISGCTRILTHWDVRINP